MIGVDAILACSAAPWQPLIAVSTLCAIGVADDKAGKTSCGRSDSA
jgi:hypothetical protein